MKVYSIIYKLITKVSGDISIKRNETGHRNHTWQPFSQPQSIKSQCSKSFFHFSFLFDRLLKELVFPVQSTARVHPRMNNVICSSSCLFCSYSWSSEQRLRERRRDRLSSDGQITCFWRGTHCCRSHSGGLLPSGDGKCNKLFPWNKI